MHTKFSVNTIQHLVPLQPPLSLLLSYSISVSLYQGVFYNRLWFLVNNKQISVPSHGACAYSVVFFFFFERPFDEPFNQIASHSSKRKRARHSTIHSATV